MMTPDGSCNLCVDAYASIAAARKVRRKILEYAVTPTTLIDIEYPPEFPGYKIEDLEIVDGIVRVKADPTVQCPLSEVVVRAATACRKGGTACAVSATSRRWRSTLTPVKWR